MNPSSRKKDKRAPNILVDDLNLFALIHIFLHFRKSARILYFDAFTRGARTGLKWLRAVGFMSPRVEKISHYIGQVRKTSGDGEYVELYSVSRRICSRIRKNELSNEPFINEVGSMWQKSRVILYFEKLAERRMERECRRIALSRWMMRNQKQGCDPHCLLLLRHVHWFRYIREYALKRGVPIDSYGPLRIADMHWENFHLVRRIGDTLRKVPGAVLRRAKAIERSRNAGGKRGRTPHRKSMVGIRYAHRKLSLDPTERSEFFWLHTCNIPLSDVLIYDYYSGQGLDPKTLEEIQALGIKITGQGYGAGVPNWWPTPAVFRIFVRVLGRLIIGALQCLKQGRWASAYIAGNLALLAANYAYWHDFFYSNGILLNVGSNNTNLAQVLAIDDLHGISLAYQYSMSNIVGHDTYNVSGENVQFLFSRYFQRLRRGLDAPGDVLAVSGLICGGNQMAWKNGSRIGEMIETLRENGAKFTMCFFDEHSRDRWFIPVWDKDSSKDYEFLLKWVLEDPTLGIVFKPKNSLTLFKRISRVSGLIEKATKTGRCFFLTSEHLSGGTYPSEVAQQVDLCIGVLIGATAALEARLAGCPTVLIDPQRTYLHPFYAWGQDQVVFKEWGSLKDAVEKYREDPGVCRDLGDWSRGLKDVDSFLDGRGSLRLGSFIQWLYEGLKQGMPREQALALASRKYEERWGEGYIWSNLPKPAADGLAGMPG